jgi:hypothetical protein
MLPEFLEGMVEIGKPASMTDEECGSIGAWIVDVDEKGNPARRRFVMSFKPNKEDIEAINAGRPIYLSITAQQLVPVGLFTLDENDVLNE